MGKTIGVLSLKGGVGKTSSVVALGDALADLGKKVLLVDGNLSSPTLGLHLNILNPEKTLHDVLDRLDNIKDAIYNAGKVDVLPASLINRKVVNPLELRNRLRGLKKEYDYTLIDSSPALNDETLGAMIASDEMFVVTTPDVPTLSMTMKAVKMAKKQGAFISGIILNKVYGKDFEIPLKNIEEMTGVPILAVIPHDINVLKSVANYQPLTSFKPKSNASMEFKKLANAITGVKKTKGRLKKAMEKFFPDRQTINREVYYNRVFCDKEKVN